ncbi:unnamed protein product [Peniophora sp. CBMAI 1063]|nr:unnamed protein product [Peniophora sp. CBMAI 1063]
MAQRTEFGVVIIGAGIGGLGMGMTFKRKLGFDDFVIFERDCDVGGTWRANTYPGCSSDVMIHGYCYSNVLKPDWTKSRGGQAEILSYLMDVAEKYDLRRHCVFDTSVTKAEWDQHASLWRISATTKGRTSQVTAKILVSATGILVEPNVPDIPGAAEFKGPRFHSARYRHDVDLRGKKVAVIGNGCSAAQIIPAISEDPDVEVVEYCRTPMWYVQGAHIPYSSFWKWVYANIPFIMWLHRIRTQTMHELGWFIVGFRSEFMREWTRKSMMRYIRAKVPKEYADRMIPDYAPGCRRIIFDNEYLSSLHRPNVTPVFKGVRRIAEGGIIDDDGVHRPCDIIIYATGFVTDRFPIHIQGKSGQPLGDFFEEQGGPLAYLGTTVPDFPNFMLVQGPNTTTGHASVIISEECQFNYAMELFKPILKGELDSVEPTQDATSRYNKWLSARLSTSVFTLCTSWYRAGGTGKVFSNFPGPLTLFWWLTLSPRWSDYEVQGVHKGVWVQKRRMSGILRRLAFLTALTGASVMAHVAGIMRLGSAEGVWASVKALISPIIPSRKAGSEIQIQVPLRSSALANPWLPPTGRLRYTVLNLPRSLFVPNPGSVLRRSVGRKRRPKTCKQSIGPLDMAHRTDYGVVIIGAGIGGIGMGMTLKRKLGYEDFVIFERDSDFGGTWRANTYPGCASDIRIHGYSYSNVLKPDWQKTHGSQPEILEYLVGVAEKFGLRPHCVFNTSVTNAEWDQAASIWRINTTNTKGEILTVRAKVLVSAMGVLVDPSIPDVPGMDRFKGPIFHSARYRHDVDLRGKNVAVVGNGCSGAQIVTAISKDTTIDVTQYCRSPMWYMPGGHMPYSSFWKWVYATIPFTLRFHRIRTQLTHDSRWFRVGFRNPSTRAGVEKRMTAYIEQKAPKEHVNKMIPNYPPGCRRMIVDNGYLASLSRPNVTPVFSGVAEVTETGIIGEDGVHRPCDVIILATGFLVDKYPFAIRGRSGKHLDDYFVEQGGPTAYLGSTIPDFPNFMLVQGPNTSTGHASAIFTEECQFNYAVQLFKPVLRGELDAVEPTPAATTRYNEWLYSRLSTSVFTECTSWYRAGGNGKIISNFPGPLALFWWLTLSPRWSDYNVRGSRKTMWIFKRRTASLLRGLGYLLAITGVPIAAQAAGIVDVAPLGRAWMGMHSLLLNWMQSVQV